MIEVSIEKWEDVDLEMLASIAVPCRSRYGIVQELETFKEYIDSLKASYGRAHYDWIITAHDEKGLAGWTAVWRWDINTLRVSNWTPYIRNDEPKLAHALIRKIVEIASEKNLNRIHLALNRVDQKKKSAYSKLLSWYSSSGFYDFYQEYFMRSMLNDYDSNPISLPDGFEVTNIDDWDKDNLCDVYIKSFNKSLDRFFKQRSQKNRKERFLGLMESEHTIKNASFVLSKGDTIAGFSIVTDHFPPAHLGPFAVHPEYRREGLGTILANLSVNAIAEQEYDSISLEVDTENTPAFELYSSVGFNIESTSHVLRWENTQSSK
jgi:ribosomal protein S18 acetylase RimI-like enzyme